MKAPPVLLLTDLDGTLLDHEHYRVDAAVQALAAARERQIPIVFNTSKTLAECLHLQQQLDLDDPIIFENGAGVALPVNQWPNRTWPVSQWQRTADDVQETDHWLIPLAPPYEHIRDVLHQLRRDRHFRFTGFGDMTTAEISDATGLALEHAAAARQRHFDEPLLWQDTAPRFAEFFQAIRATGLTITRGGRFLHVMGPADKGRAMLWLARLYSPPRPKLVALGDSDNDLPMLRAADIAVLVRSPAQQLPELGVPGASLPDRLIVTDKEGPAGWNTAVLSLLEEFARG